MSAPTNFQVTGCNSVWKINCFHFFPIEKHKLPNLTLCKKGQGQPRDTIHVNFVELESPMLNAKFQDHRTSGSGEVDFLRFLPYMGMAAILVMWPGPFIYTFVPPSQGGSTYNLALIGQAVSEEKIFENGGRTDDGRTPARWVYYKLTLWA